MKVRSIKVKTTFTCLSLESAELSSKVSVSGVVSLSLSRSVGRSVCIPEMPMFGVSSWPLMKGRVSWKIS